MRRARPRERAAQPPQRAAVEDGLGGGPGPAAPAAAPVAGAAADELVAHRPAAQRRSGREPGLGAGAELAHEPPAHEGLPAAVVTGEPPPHLLEGRGHGVAPRRPGPRRRLLHGDQGDLAPLLVRQAKRVQVRQSALVRVPPVLDQAAAGGGLAGGEFMLSSRARSVLPHGVRGE